MQVTDWLVVVFIVAIVVVMLDGVRRKLLDRRDRVVLKIDRNLPRNEFDEELLSSAELPNGGARTLPRAGQSTRSLRNLKPTRPQRPLRRETEDSETLRTVPVLMDAVELEEEHIEHTNVFADTSATRSFEADDFNEAAHTFAQSASHGDREEDWDADDEAEEYGDALSEEARARKHRPTTRQEESWADEDDEEERRAEGEELDDDSEEEQEDVSMLREELAARRHQAYEARYADRSVEARYQAGDDDDEEAFEEEEFEEDEFEEELNVPEDFEDEEDEEDDEDFDEDYEDEDDEEDDEDDEELDEDEEDEDDEEDEELDELGGYPEDEWGTEEEQDLLVDDYENEPMLLQDTYNKAASHFSRIPRQPRIEPGFGNDVFNEDELDEDFSVAQTDVTEEAQAAAAESMRPIPTARHPVAPAAVKPQPEPAAPKPALAPPEPKAVAPAVPKVEAPPRVEPVAEKPVLSKPDQGELFREEGRLKAKAAAAKKAPAPKEAAPPAPVDPGPQEVIIINVMARPGETLQGFELLPVLQQQGLRLGEMSIFHRHADTNGNGAVMFSMANMVKPGTFDLAAMEDFSTPGVSFFLQMPNALGNMQSFELMLGAATAVRNVLDGDLKDENRSVFTRQTVEHCRQRVRDFELKLLSRK